MAQQPQNQGEDSDDIIKLVILLSIAVMIALYFIGLQRMKFNAIIGAITWVHILPFGMAARYVPQLCDIPFLGGWLFDYSRQGLDFLEQGGFAAMNGQALNAVLVAGGRAATVIYGGVLTAIAIFGQNTRVDLQYRNLYSLEAMIQIQSDHWVTSRIARHINPLKSKDVGPRMIADAVNAKVKQNARIKGGLVPYRPAAIRPGSWSRALRPEEWLTSNGLTFDPEHYKVLSDPDAVTPDFEFNFKKSWEGLELEALSELLSAQLRSPWRGPEHLRPSQRAIFAVMALFYSYDINKANELLNDLALVADGNKVKSGTMDEAIKAENGLMARIDKIAFGTEGKRIRSVADQHAWVESAFPAMLAASRKDRGVLPTAAFLWLKSEDRLLWYILNNVGNDAIMIEAAGAIAHARAESQISRPLTRPAVYQASRAILEDYLDMTPDRIASRHQKEIAKRTPGEQLANIRDEILDAAKAGPADVDGVQDEDITSETDADRKEDLI